MREGGGNCLKYLKRVWNRKEGRGDKNFKKGGQAGSRGGCLKRGGGGWNHLTNNEDIKLLYQYHIVEKIFCGGHFIEAVPKPWFFVKR